MRQLLSQLHTMRHLLLQFQLTHMLTFFSFFFGPFSFSLLQEFPFVFLQAKNRSKYLKA